jgi:hypothetical protein
VSWQSFWTGIAEKCDAAAAKADKKYNENLAKMTLGQTLGIPKCVFCKDKRRSFTVVRQFTYSVDRLSRGRVKVLLRCDACQMQAVCMRWGDSKRWSWFESN